MKSMLYALFLWGCFISLSANGQKRTRMIRVSGTVTQTTDYCGGARPTDEMLENLRKPQPLPGKVLYIKTGAENREGQPVYKQVQCDSLGQFSVRLPAGKTYVFVEAWKAKAFQMPEDTEWVIWDKACWRKRYQAGDYVLRPGKQAAVRISINYHQPCFYAPYCGQYSGPLPP